jgi:hypothetical protein
VSEDWDDAGTPAELDDDELELDLDDADVWREDDGDDL